MELWDAYDDRFNRIENVTLVRGEDIPDGCFHIVSEIIVRHADGSYLLMQRDLRKHRGGLWEASAGGSAICGEDPYECAVRELYEETGIRAEKLTELGRVLDRARGTYYFEYLYVTDDPKESIVLQEGETTAYKWLSAEEVRNMPRDEMASYRIFCFVKELK